MTTDAEHAAQVRARLAASTSTEQWLSGEALTAHITATDELIAHAPDDLTRLLASRDEWQARAERAEAGLETAKANLIAEIDRAVARETQTSNELRAIRGATDYMEQTHDQLIDRAERAEAKVARLEALSPERIVTITRHSLEAVPYDRLHAALVDPEVQP